MSELDNLFNQYVSGGKAENKPTRAEFKPLILDDDTQDIDANKKDQQTIPQYVDVDKVSEQQFVQPERRSYFVAGNVNNNEINTTAQKPNEIEYEANTIDDEKKKDDYFALTKLSTNKKDIVKNAIKYITGAANPIQSAINTVGSFTGKDDKEIVLEGVRGFTGSTIDFASSLYRFFKQNTDIAKTYTKEQLDKIANLGNVMTGGESFANDIAEQYTEFYKQIDEENKILRDKTERFLQYTGIAKTDKDGFIYDLVGGGASLMYAIGLAAITKSPAAAAEMFGMYQYQSLYEEGIDRGFSPIKARAIGVAGGAFEGGLEMVGLHVLIETLKARRSFTKILKAALTEFTQEASQQGAEETLAKLSGLREDSTVGQIISNVFYAGVIGAILGGGSATVSNVFYKQISDSATRELINNGMQSDYAKQMVDNVLKLSVSPQAAQEVVSISKDEQSPVTYKNADPRETYKEFGDTVKKALDPAQKRGVELELIQANKKLTQELANVLLNSGKAQNGDDAYRRAEQVTAMYDMLAREAYNQYGISPSEYYKRFHVNAQSGNIEIDERNVDEDNPFVDVSFDPVDFDPEARAAYEAAMDAEQDYMDQVEKENKTTLKTEARILGDMGIDAIRRPTPDGVGKDRWGEYKDLSNRIKNYFFSDDPTAMSWDDAEKLLAESSSDIKDLFAYLAAVDDRAVTLNQPGVFNRVLAKEKERIKQQAIADGTFLKAPNGKDSNLPEQLWLIVRTKAFKNWFGDWENSPETASKVVDENGEPLIVYHGTKADFSVFEGQRIANTSEGAGFYFTPNKNLAQGFGNVKAVFLNIRNPQYAYGNIDLVSDTYEEDCEKENKEAIDKGLQEVKKKLEKKGYKFYKQVQKDLFDVIGTQTQEVLDGLLYLRNFVENENFDEEKIYNDIREAEKEVFKIDGYTTNRYGGDQKVYVAFTSNQIKSINNRGSFDRRNPDIYYQPAWHGGPRDFDRFDLSFVLSGEGSMAHAWGVYGAAERNVSEGYRKGLSRDKILYDGKEISDKIKDKIDIVISNLIFTDDSNKLKMLKSGIKKIIEGYKKATEIYKDDIKRYKDSLGLLNKNKDKTLSELSVIAKNVFPLNTFVDTALFDEEEKTKTKEELLQYFEKTLKKQIEIFKEDIARNEQDAKELESMDLDKWSIEKNKGQLYKIDIPENDVLLDEQKYFDEQPKKVQEAILKIGKDLNISDLQFEAKDDFLKKVENKFGKKAREIFEKIYNAELQREKEERSNLLKQETLQKVEQAWDEWNKFETENNIDRNDFNPNSVYKAIDSTIIDGRNIYENIVSYFVHNKNIYGRREAAKQASLLLNRYGVKGETYEGGRDGRAFVIFDDKAVKILEKFYQQRNNRAVAPLTLNETNISQNTSLNGLKNKNNGNLELHTKAKAGDYRSAFELIKRVVKQNVVDEIKQLAQNHKEAVVLPLLAREDSGDNQLPKAYADIIADATGLSVDRRIKQINQTNHTNETRVERLSDLAEFEGEVVKGQEYILVDDVMTTGSNINELRKYIERQGGKVIHVAVLATGRQGKKVFQPIVAETEKMLYNKLEGILNGNEKSETNITNQQTEQEQKVDTTRDRRNDEQLSQDRQNSKRVRSESDLYRLINLYLQSKNIANSIEELTEGQAKDILSDDFVIDKKELTELEKSQLFQDNEQDQPRGAITSFDRQYWIDLFSGSDKSTLLHEGSHGWLSEVLYFANGKNPSPKILAIKKQLDSWLGEPEDNGRYSKRQQELFAGASEVYFMEGKAPTPKLKTVFERFKKWLTDIYDAIRNDLPKINDDVRELFDTILSRSYDVPDSNIYAGKEKAIKEVIKNIQEGRASEVDGITIDDVYNLLNVAYTRKPSKPSKNLKQLLNDKNIYDFNELNKAGADTVLQILKDGGYVKEGATAEAAMDLARKALDGEPVYRLADQWRVAGDIDFARNLRVLERVIEFSQIDSTIEKILELQEEGYRNVEQGDVEQVQNDYKRLFSADVKEAKKIVEDIINRLHKKRFIDRAAQKQMIVDLNFSSTVEEIRESVLNVIEDLQDEIKLVKEQLRNPRKPIVRKDKTIPPAKDATEEEKNNYKKYMRKLINRLLKQALPRKQNQQKFSKFDVQAQRFFTDLEKYNKMTIEAAQEELYKRATSIIDDEGVGLDNFEKMKNMFLSYKANKINQNSVEFYKQLYDNLQEINVFGRNAKDIENTLKKEQIQQDINNLVVNIEDNKSKNKVATGVKKQYIKWLGNWWSTINAIAGKKQADKDSLERIEIDIFNKNYETTENLKTKCAAALGLKNATDLDMTVNRYLNEEYTYEENDPRSNTSNAVKLNKMQLICCYIWMKNSTLRERIVRAFGNIQIMDMMDKLTIQDKKFGDELQQSVADMYDEVNTVYLKMYGLDMPQAENYFPSSVERIQGNMDLLKDNIGQVSSPGFIKARVQSNLPLMNFGNPVKIALDHIAKVNHFIYMQEKLADLNKVYKTTVVKRHITNAYGDRVYAYILQVLDNAKFTTVARTIDGISDIGDYLVNNYVLTKIAVKPSIMMKQLLSCINYAEDMSAEKWFEGFLKGVASPKKTIDFMMKNSKYCQSRFAKGGQSEALLKAMEGSNATFAKVKTFKGMLSWMTRVGDIGAIIFGGYPYVMDQMSKGVPLKTAIENFERATIRSQQASLPSTLSNFQYRGMNSWLYRAMFAFANTPNQYSRKMGDAVYMYMHGDIDKKQLAKTLVIYGVLNPILYSSFTSLAILSGLVSGDWDDLKDDIIMSLFQTSNVLSLPLFSIVYNNIVAWRVTGKYLPDKQIPLLDDMLKVMKTVTKEDIEMKDWLTVVDEVASLVFGVPVKTLYNTFVGSTKDLLDGEYGKFAVKLYGATESRANKIFD